MSARIRNGQIDKIVTAPEALAESPDACKSGVRVMIGGFGVPGTPMHLIDALLNSGCDRLTLIKNEANIKGLGISRLLEAGRVDILIASHLGLNTLCIEMMNKGEIQVQLNPQGILAERIRAGGAGLAGILTDIGVDTLVAENKQVVEVDGRRVLVETALRADLALIHAAKGDRLGNLVYEKSARNFNPLMAAAADRVVAEVEELVPVGELKPDEIHTPGGFVDAVVKIPEINSDYEVLEAFVHA